MTTFPGRCFLGGVWLVLACVPATSLTSPAQARTIYVRQSGDDANDGSSPAAALRTIGKGAALAVSGDIVLVGPGLYVEGDIAPAVFGQVRFQADRRGTAVGDPAGDVVVDANGFTSGFDFNGKLAIAIDGFVVYGASIGIYVKSGSHRAVVSNNVVCNNRTRGIYVQDSRDAVVFNNLVYNNGSTGILVTGNTTGSPGAWVLNNTVYRNVDRGIFFSGTPLSPNGLVLNNVVEGNGSAGIQVNGTSLAGYLSAGNVVFDNRFFPGTPIDATDIQADPLFVDPDGADDILGGNGYADDDFRLSQERAGQTVTSPAVDAGSDLSRRLNLLQASTRSDRRPDRGVVDAGYHYANFTSPPADPKRRLRFKKVWVSATGGDDANDGASRETAWRTLGYALSKVRVGHMLMVVGGIYSEGQLSLRESGVPGRPIVIKAVNGARVNGSTGQSGLLLSGVNHIVVDGLRIDGAGESGIEIRNSFSQTAGTENIVLRRLRLAANGRRGLALRNAGGVRLISSAVEGNGSRGVQVEGAALGIEGCTIRDNIDTGVWAFAGASVAISQTQFAGNGSDGVLVEESDVSIAGGSIRGSKNGGVRFRAGSTGSLENVDVLDITDVGVQAISSVVGISASRIRGNSIGLQAFVDPIVRLPVEVAVESSQICDNRNSGIDAEETVLTVSATELCASGSGVGLRQRGGSADVVGGKIRSNPDGGISTSDAERLSVRGVLVENNQGNGIQVVRTAAVSIEDSVVRSNGGDGVTILDSPAAEVVNNLVSGNGSSGILISGDTVGSPGAMVLSNTVYDNANRGLLIGGSVLKPTSDNAVVMRNIFRHNGTAGIQVNTLSQLGYVGDFNLSTDPYNAEVGMHDVLADPLFVNPDAGDFHLSQTAAGQAQSSPAVDAGDVAATAVGMNAKTTRTDHVADRGAVDLGYHYLP